jgi:exodeoxyribonuclease VII small subunit
MADGRSPVEGMSFEEAYAELQQVVQELEIGQSTLEDSLAMFERGKSLAQHCQGLLERAELRVRHLEDPSAEKDEAA